MEPTVPTRRSSESSGAVWKLAGLVSVMPYAIPTSSMCISLVTRFITSMGHELPAMMPVRSEERS